MRFLNPRVSKNELPIHRLRQELECIWYYPAKLVAENIIDASQWKKDI